MLGLLFDEHAAHEAPFGAGLGRDQRHADDLLRRRFGLVRRGGELDAAALAAAAGVDLRLDDGRDAELARDVPRLCGVYATRPRGTGTPYLARSSFAWYSWTFTASPLGLRARIALSVVESSTLNA